MRTRGHLVRSVRSILSCSVQTRVGRKLLFYFPCFSSSALFLSTVAICKCPLYTLYNVHCMLFWGRRNPGIICSPTHTSPSNSFSQAHNPDLLILLGTWYLVFGICYLVLVERWGCRMLVSCPSCSCASHRTHFGADGPLHL